MSADKEELHWIEDLVEMDEANWKRMRETLRRLFPPLPRADAWPRSMPAALISTQPHRNWWWEDVMSEEETLP